MHNITSPIYPVLHSLSFVIEVGELFLFSFIFLINFFLLLPSTESSTRQSLSTHMNVWGNDVNNFPSITRWKESHKIFLSSFPVWGFEGKYLRQELKTYVSESHLYFITGEIFLRTANEIVLWKEELREWERAIKESGKFSSTWLQFFALNPTKATKFTLPLHESHELLSNFPHHCTRKWTLLQISLEFLRENIFYHTPLGWWKPITAKVEVRLDSRAGELCEWHSKSKLFFQCASSQAHAGKSCVAGWKWICWKRFSFFIARINDQWHDIWHMNW